MNNLKFNYIDVFNYIFIINTEEILLYIDVQYSNKHEYKVKLKILVYNIL